MMQAIGGAWRDFPAIDVQQLLEQLALAAIDAALTGVATEPPELSRPRVSALLATLAPESALSYRDRQAARRMAYNYSLTDPPAHRRRAALWLGRALRTPLRVRFVSWAERRFRLIAPGIAEAQGTADALAANAWGVPEFQIKLAHRIRTHVRERVLMHPAHSGLPTLSDETFWLLCAIWLSDRKTGLKQREHDAILGAISAHANARASAAQWAGFWDAFVLMQMVDRFKNRPDVVIPDAALKLCDQLRDLPGPMDDAAAEEADFMQSDWRARSPAFGEALVSKSI